LYRLLQQVQRQATEQLQQAARLPGDVRFRFDAAWEATDNGEQHEAAVAVGHVQKTVHRSVVSLQHGRFEACETVRQAAGDGSAAVRRSACLSEVVAPGATYAFDLIAHVGVETYLHGRSLREVRQELACQQPALEIPSSSLWDQQQKFLFYLGYLHDQAAPVLCQYLAERGPRCWLLDGTAEPGTPVFLGVREAASGLFLLGRKIPSENIEDIRPCLQDTATRYGRPDRVLHDLSPAMSGACDAALPGVPHFVCHYHLARDVGEDLYAQPQTALVKRQRTLKLQARLREQRRGQSEWFRQRPEGPGQFMLSRLLAGTPVDVPFDDSLGREVLLAFHFWILDYRSDGRRRGFPFDPYTLFLHRRLIRASEAVDRLLAGAAVGRQAPQTLKNFQELLRQYRSDSQIVAAAEDYERSHAMFTRLRDALRLSADTMDQLREPLELTACELPELQSALTELRSELRQQTQDPQDADRPLASMVLQHLDKYWSYLIPDRPLGKGEPWERTTNKLEKQWGSLKRGRRQSHGRGKLTRDFQALPEEYLLVPNLENPLYLELVLGGGLEALPSKLAAASRCAGSFDAWRRRRYPRLIGQLRRRLLRDAEFLPQLVDACRHHCQRSRRQVA
jgi:hypothetical protein